MSAAPEVTAVPTAGVRRRRRIPLVWIVPAVTALIALWLGWDTWSKRGPTITIAFDQGDGLQAGQSQLRFRQFTLIVNIAGPLSSPTGPGAVIVRSGAASLSLIVPVRLRVPAFTLTKDVN